MQASNRALPSLSPLSMLAPSAQVELRPSQPAARMIGPGSISARRRDQIGTLFRSRSFEFMGGLQDVARETCFEAKESGESRNGIGGRWGVVAGGR